MKEIQFTTKAAKKLYTDYIERCEKMLRILSKKDRMDCMLEINSYIYEFISDKNNGDEHESLSQVLARLGDPKITLKEVVALKKVEQATRSFNPVHLLQALLLNISNGFIYTVLFVMFLFLLCFPVLILLKLIYPSRLGFFVGNGNWHVGMTNAAHASETPEMLGNLFIPTMIFCFACVYVGIILLLRLTRKIKAR